MLNDKTCKITPTDVLLEKARSCLNELIESSFLDCGEMIRACMEDFDNFEWEPSKKITASEFERWEDLHQAGLDFDLDEAGLHEFFTLCDPDCQGHMYRTRIQARVLLEQITEHQAEIGTMGPVA